MLAKQEKRIRRHKRVRAKIKGSASRPRLCVFRSLKHIYAQVVDDEKGHTLISVSDSELKKQVSYAKKKSNTDIKGKNKIAYEVGKILAKKAEEKDIKEVVFDRGGYLYHGRVKALADGAREGGLKF